MFNAFDVLEVNRYFWIFPTSKLFSLAFTINFAMNTRRHGENTEAQLDDAFWPWFQLCKRVRRFHFGSYGLWKSKQPIQNCPVLLPTRTSHTFEKVFKNLFTFSTSFSALEKSRENAINSVNLMDHFLPFDEIFNLFIFAKHFELFSRQNDIIQRY